MSRSAQHTTAVQKQTKANQANPFIIQDQINGLAMPYQANGLMLNTRSLSLLCE